MAKISMKEVEKHNKASDIWIVIDKKVYDVTKYLNNHPGGPHVLLNLAGKDATEEFNNLPHSDAAKNIMKKYYIGDLE